MVASEGFHPMLVVLRSLPQRLLGNGVDAVHVAKEINDVRRTSEQREITLDDDAIKAVVYKDQQAGQQLAEGFHRSSFLCFCGQQDHRIEDRGSPEWQTEASASGMLG
jgi:hypothetical protein